jgi:hypothetical protein
VKHLNGGGLLGLLACAGMLGVTAGLLASPLIETWLAPFVRSCALVSLAHFERRLEAVIARFPCAASP